MVTQSKNNHPRKILITILILAVFAGAAFLIVKKYRTSTVTYQSNNVYNSNSSNTSNNNSSQTDNSNQHSEIPKTAQLTVAFTAQAPTANWDELHNEACEEASAIMANAYFTHISSLPPATVEKQITELTKWQDDNFGYHLSVSTTEAATMIEENYKLKTDIVPLNEQTIKQAIADGKLVIYPANGQLLNNPNFKTPGPIYHMLVITGYNGDNIITNDPGTRNGLNYKYSYSTLESAGGTYNHDTKSVDLNDKQIIIVSK